MYVVAAVLIPTAAFAQSSPTQAPPQPSPPAPQAQPGQAAQQQQAPAQQQFAQSPAWANLPKMQLERQFSGPLQDTIVQRWRDPVDGTVCYIYLPISAPVAAPNAAGFQQYGPNTIGSISCLPGGARPAAAKR